MTKQQNISPSIEFPKPLTEKQVEKLIPIFSPTPLIRFPYFVSLGRRGRKKEISVQETRRDGTIEKWAVTSPLYLPGEMEQKIWIYILHTISQAKKPLPQDAYISYSLKGIARYLNLPQTGKTLSLIARAIDNLRNTEIHHRIEPTEGPPSAMRYSLVSGWIGRGAKKDDQILEQNIIYINPIVSNFINGGHVKPESLAMLKQLADLNLISARLYEILSYKHYLSKANGSDNIYLFYSDLVRKTGLRKERYLSQAKDQLKKPHQHLKKQGVISGTPAWEKFHNDWRIIYAPGNNLTAEIREWEKLKNLRYVPSLPDPELEYALEDIAEYVGEGEKYAFRNIVSKIFLEDHTNGCEMVSRAISEAKAEEPGGKVKNRAAYLTTILKKYVK